MEQITISFHGDDADGLKTAFEDWFKESIPYCSPWIAREADVKSVNIEFVGDVIHVREGE